MADWSQVEAACLEVRAPWAAALLDGSKPVETRTYALPPALVGARLLVLESAAGDGAASATPDYVDCELGGLVVAAADAVASGALHVAGEVVFDASFEYASEAEWAADEARHRVGASDASFSWAAVRARGGGEARIHGWRVGLRAAWDDARRAAFARSRRPRALLRVERSLFALRLGADADGAARELDLPTLDVTPFMRGARASGADRAACAAAAVEQCTRVGFLRVTWEGYDRAVVAEAHARLGAFFARPEADKRAASKAAVAKATDSFTSSGYRGVGGSEYNKFRQSWSCQTPAHAPSSPSLGAERARRGVPADDGDGDGDYVRSAAGRRHFAEAPDPQVPWPTFGPAGEGEVDEGFRAAVLAYYAMCEAASAALVAAFEAGLALAPGTLARHMRHHVTSMNCYSHAAPASAAERFPAPAAEGCAGAGGERERAPPAPAAAPQVLGAHGDASVLTLLSHGGRGAPGCAGEGLEVLAPREQPGASGGGAALAWRRVRPREGSLLMNVGQILTRWSGGQLKATLHRVARPTWLPGGATRQAIAYFCVPSPYAPVDCLVPGLPRTLPAETYEAFHARRLSGFYGPGASALEAWRTYNADILAFDADGRLDAAVRGELRGEVPAA